MNRTEILGLCEYLKLQGWNNANELKEYIDNLEKINKDHQKLNGELRQELSACKEDNLFQMNKIKSVKHYIEKEVLPYQNYLDGENIKAILEMLGK